MCMCVDACVLYMRLQVCNYFSQFIQNFYSFIFHSCICARFFQRKLVIWYISLKCVILFTWFLFFVSPLHNLILSYFHLLFHLLSQQLFQRSPELSSHLILAKEMKNVKTEMTYQQWNLIYFGRQFINVYFFNVIVFISNIWIVSFSF